MKPLYGVVSRQEGFQMAHYWYDTDVQAGNLFAGLLHSMQRPTPLQKEIPSSILGTLVGHL